MQKDRLWVIVLFFLTQINRFTVFWGKLKHSIFYKAIQKILSIILLIGSLLPAIWATCFSCFYLLTLTGMMKGSEHIESLLWIPLWYFMIFMGPLVIYFSPILVLIAYAVSFKAVKRSMKYIGHTT